MLGGIKMIVNVIMRDCLSLHLKTRSDHNMGTIIHIFICICVHVIDLYKFVFCETIIFYCDS